MIVSRVSFFPTSVAFAPPADPLAVEFVPIPPALSVELPLPVAEAELEAVELDELDPERVPLAAELDL